MMARLDRKTARPALPILGLALVTLVLASCGYPPAACDPSEMPAPVLLSPGVVLPEWHVHDETSRTPTFTWAYPGECSPDGYQIVVSKYRSILYPEVNEDVHPEAGPTITRIGGPAYPTFRWTLSEALDPGSVYYWRITPYSGALSGERSEWGVFLTGPLCGARGATAAPRPMSPGNGSTLPDARVVFMWDDPSPCAMSMNNEGYELELSTSPSFPRGTGETIFMNCSHLTLCPWDGTVSLPYCAHYYWRLQYVRYGPYGPEPIGPYSDVWDFYTPEIPEIGGCAMPTPESSVAEPLPAYGLPEAMAREDAICRTGPSTQFNIATYFVQGQVIPITGRLSEGGWWKVQPPDLQVPCWISEDVVEPYGDLTQVPIAIAPALPAEEPTEGAPSQAQGCWCPDPMQNNLCVYTVPCQVGCKACTPPSQ